MTTHETKSVFGKPLKFVTRDYDAKDPLELTIEYTGTQKGGVLVKRADAIVLRDMLIESLGLPEPEPAKATTSKLGEPVEFEASNGYTIIDRSPFGLKVYDAGGHEKYNVGKYTVAALREYFDRPYVAPEPPKPTLEETFAALEIGARFAFVDQEQGLQDGEIAVKVEDDRYYRGGHVYPMNLHSRSGRLGIEAV